MWLVRMNNGCREHACTCPKLYYKWRVFRKVYWQMYWKWHYFKGSTSRKWNTDEKGLFNKISHFYSIYCKKTNKQESCAWCVNHWTQTILDVKFSSQTNCFCVSRVHKLHFKWSFMHRHTLVRAQARTHTQCTLLILMLHHMMICTCKIFYM